MLLALGRSTAVAKTTGRHLSQWRPRRDVDAVEAAKSGLDLAVTRELIADLGRELGDLIRDIVQHQRPRLDQRPTMFKHGFDLRYQWVEDIESLNGPERRLGL